MVKRKEIGEELEEELARSEDEAEAEAESEAEAEESEAEAEAEESEAEAEAEESEAESEEEPVEAPKKKKAKAKAKAAPEQVRSTSRKVVPPGGSGAPKAAATSAAPPAQPKRKRSRGGSGVEREKARPHRKLTNEKLRAMIKETEDRVEADDVKLRVQMMRLKRYKAEVGYRGGPAAVGYGAGHRGTKLVTVLGDADDYEEDDESGDE